MNRRLVFRPQALREVHRAADWYKERGAGLDADFLRALDVAVASVSRNPAQYQIVHNELRHALLRRFPYSLIYRFTEDEIVIVACSHWRQDPKRWMNRG